jgi:hypothetical protein
MVPVISELSDVSGPCMSRVPVWLGGSLQLAETYDIHISNLLN